MNVAFVSGVLMGTPWWVWVVLVYLIVVGINASRHQIVYLPRLFIIPILLIGFKYKFFLAGSAWLILLYLASLSLGVGIGFLQGMRAKVRIFRELLYVEIPGSWWTLFLLLTIFCINFMLGVLWALDPLLAAKYFAVVLSISAMITGFFLGKALSCLNRFLKHS